MTTVTPGLVIDLRTNMRLNSATSSTEQVSNFLKSYTKEGNDESASVVWTNLIKYFVIRCYTEVDFQHAPVTNVMIGLT